MKKSGRGRPPVPPEASIDARFTMSFPTVRSSELRAAAQREGLPVSAYLRRVILLHLDHEAA